MVLQRVTQNQVNGQADPYAELDRLNEQYTMILNWQDVVVRALHNPKFSPYNFRLFVSLIDTYPDLLTDLGRQREIEVSLVRKNAGAIKESCATHFFQDMSTIEAIVYESRYDKTVGKKRSFVTALPALSLPEDFDTASTERKRIAKEKEEKRRKQFKNPRQIFTCDSCGSNDLVYDAIPRCLSCGFVHEPIKDIPASMITIEAELIELADEVPPWEDDFAVGTAAAPETPRPAATQAFIWEPSRTAPLIDPLVPDPETRPKMPCRICGISCWVWRVSEGKGDWYQACIGKHWRGEKLDGNY